MHHLLCGPQLVWGFASAKLAAASRLTLSPQALLVFILVLALSVLTKVDAQVVFPVLVQQVPPTSLGSLNDLTSPALSTWQVSVTLQDPREPSIQAALRVKLTGNNFTATTTDPTRAPLLTLATGLPTVLTAQDLAAYLAPGNVTLQGVNPQTFYADGAVLPEGAYTICVEVLPLLRPGGASASGEGCSAIMAQAYDPPQFIVPYEGEQVLPVEPQFLVFNWQHVSPAPIGVTYQLEVFEVGAASGIVSTVDLIRLTAPMSIINAGPQLSYALSAADPQLTVGREYVARLRMVDLMGRLAIRNQGYSRPIRFRYGVGAAATGNCLPVINVQTSHVGQTDAQLSWSPPNATTSYRSYVVQVRLVGQATGFEYLVEAGTGLNVPNLVRDTDYEFQVIGICASGGRTSGVGGRFRTLTDVKDNPRIAGCATQLPAVATTATGSDLQQGQTLSFKGVEVELGAVTRSGQSYAGDATLILPWLEQGLLHVKVAGLQVGANGVATAGTLTPVKNQNVVPFNPAAYVANFGDQSCSGTYAKQTFDDKGFYPDGKHYVTGTTLNPRDFDRDGVYRGPGAKQPPVKYDTSGFDINGNYVGINGEHLPGGLGPYNPAGCDRDGYDANGFPCGRGSTIDSVIADYSEFYTADWGDGGFLDSLAEVGVGLLPPGAQANAKRIIDATRAESWSLRDTVEKYLMVAVAQKVDSVTIARVQALAKFADSARIKGFVQQLDARREELYGEGDALLQQGMSELFSDGFPTPLNVPGRPQEILDYENYVAELFQADRDRITNFDPKLEVLQEFGEYDLQGVLITSLLDVLSTRTLPELATLIGNPVELLSLATQTVTAQLSKLMQQRAGNGFGMLEWERGGFRQNSLDPFRHGAEAGLWASLDGAFAATSPPPPPNLRSLLPPPSRHPVFGYELPIKLERVIAGETFTVVIEDIVINLNGAATLNAYAVLPVPGSPGEALVFRGTNIPFTRGGIGETKLALVSKATFGLGGLGSFETSVPTGNAPAKNYVTIDCDGFKDFSLDGQLAFCRQIVQPVNASGQVLTADTERARAQLTASGTDWPNFVLQGSMAQPFVATGHDDVHWHAQNIVVDYSQDETPSTVVFPQGYQPATDLPKWRGVYIGTLGADFVSAFKDNQDAYPKLTATQLVLDNTGVSVAMKATDVLPRNRGKIGTWAVGIKKLDVTLRQNQLALFALDGELELPTGKSKNPGGVGDILNYSGSYSTVSGSRTLGFAVSPPARALGWDIWRGTIDVAQTSIFGIEKSQAGWRASASLDGTVKIGGGDAPFGFEGIQVTKMVLATAAPYFSMAPGGSVALLANANRRLGGFSMSLSRLGFVLPTVAKPNRYGLNIAGAVGLMGGNGGFGAGGELTVYGQSLPDGRFVYEDFDVQQISLDIKIPAVRINGALTFAKAGQLIDGINYGNGFSGRISAQFDGLGFGIAASGTFGNVNNYDYWTVDAAATFQDPSPVTLVPPILALSTIGGGASWHMTRVGGTGQAQPINLSTPAPNKTFSFGESITGIRYEPSSSTGLSLRLIAGVATAPKRDLMAADFVLEAQFSSSWGLNYISIDGSASFLTMPDPTTGGASGNPSLRADVSVVFAPKAGAGNTPKLTGNLRGYLNYANTVRGAMGPGNYVGQISMHLERSKWFMYVGTPSQRLGVKVHPLPLAITTYLDAGSVLPDYPGVPARFADLNLRTRVTNGRAGFMHGTEISLKESMSLGPFRASIDAVAGYNVLLSNGQTCPSRSSYGIEGWRLNGAAYAGLDADLTVRAPGWACWTCPKDVNIASVNAKVAATIEGPNPFFVQGAAKFEASFFGGIFEPEWSGRVSFGERCGSVQGTVVAQWSGMFPKELLTDASPLAGDSMRLTEIPEVFAALPVETEFIDKVMSADGKTGTDKTFKLEIRMSVFRFVNGQPVQLGAASLHDRKSITGQSGYSGYYDYRGVTALGTSGQLTAWSPKERYRVVAKARLLVKGSNGAWSVFSEQGHSYQQTLTNEYTTESKPRINLIYDVYPGVPVASTLPADIREEILQSHPGGRDVDLFAYGKLDYDHTFELEDAPFGGNVTTYRPTVESIRLARRSSTQGWIDVPYRQKEDVQGQVTIRPVDPLYGDTTLYRVTAKVQLVSANGQYYRESDGSYFRDEQVRYFLTSVEPTEVLVNNVRRAYPYPEQHNVYIEEPGSDTWFMELSRPQRSLFSSTRQGGATNSHTPQ